MKSTARERRAAEPSSSSRTSDGPPPQHLLLAVQRAAGNRAVAALLQRSVLGQPRARAQMDAEVAADREYVAKIVKEAHEAPDERLANSAEVLMTDKSASLFVGTPRWNSDQIVGQQSGGDAEAAHPEYAKLIEVLYSGAAPYTDDPLFKSGREVASGKYRDQLDRREDRCPASTLGDSDGKGMVRILGPRLPSRTRAGIEETLRHEVQHNVDRTEDLLGPATPAVLDRDGVAHAMREGRRQFLTEQRAYLLERGGGMHDTREGAHDFGEQQEYAPEPCRIVTFCAKVGDVINRGKAARVVKDAAARIVLPHEPLEGQRERAQSHKSPAGMAALLKQLLGGGSYDDFTLAWLLDDILDVADRPFQRFVIDSKPEYANPMNSVRINAVWTELKKLRKSTPEDLWDMEDELPKSNSKFVDALNKLHEDELRFLVDSALFRRHLQDRSGSVEVVETLISWAEGRDRLLLALHRFRHYRAHIPMSALKARAELVL